MMPSNCKWLNVIVITLLIAPVAFCGEAESPKPEKPAAPDDAAKTPPAGDKTARDSTKKSVDKRKELAQFEDMPLVISASRHSEPISLSSTPVSVVTADDIHYSGLSVLPEIFNFVPGMDVLALDRNRYAVGVHGLHDYFSDRTLTLINGRNAESSIFGGAEYLRYPLFMEDIDHVEIVRGPGGAAWGANAFNGVVNIITKKPEDTQGVMATSTANQFGETTSQVRWGASTGKWTWRTSFGYQEYKSSEDVINHAHFESQDFAQRGQFDGEAKYKIDDQTKVSFGTGYQHARQGDYEFIGLFPNQEGRTETVRSFARVDHEFNSDFSGYLQWFNNYSDTDDPSTLSSQTSVNDLETQLNFTPFEKHHLSVGGNVRQTHITTDNVHLQDVQLPDAPVDEYFTGGFALYRWEATEKLNFEAQARGDDYSKTGADWSSRIAVLYSIDSDHHHVIRVGGAKAFRSPYIGLRDFQITRLPLPAQPPVIPAGTFLINGFPSFGLKNEEIWSADAGYTGQWIDGLLFTADGYYHHYQKLIGFDQNQTVVPGLPRPITDITAANIAGAQAFGIDTEISYKTKRGQISAWYSFNDLNTAEIRQTLRALPPAKHKAGVTGRLFLPHETTLNLNYRYTDVTGGDPNNSNKIVPVSNRLDFTVSKKLSTNFELMGGVTDVLNTTRDAAQGIGTFTEHDTPGRTFFGRFQLKF